MIGLLVDPAHSLKDLFRFALGESVPDLDLEVASEVPQQGAYDLCVFHASNNPFLLRQQVAQLRAVCKPDAVLFAYVDTPTKQTLQELLRARCRCGANLRSAAELRWLWTEVRDEVELRVAAQRDPGFGRAAVSIKELLQHWRACMHQAELAG